MDDVNPATIVFSICPFDGTVVPDAEFTIQTNSDVRSVTRLSGSMPLVSWNCTHSITGRKPALDQAAPVIS